MGLLDSGAEISVAGGEFKNIMRSRGIVPTISNNYIRTADGTTHSANEQYAVSISFAAIDKKIKILFVPSVSKLLIFGMDFWKIKPTMISAVDVDKAVVTSAAHELNEKQAAMLQSVLKLMPFSRDGAKHIKWNTVLTQATHNP